MSRYYRRHALSFPIQCTCGKRITVNRAEYSMIMMDKSRTGWTWKDRQGFMCAECVKEQAVQQLHAASNE